MKVILHTETDPENNAMLQALYSRSPASVTEHLKKLEGADTGKFMEKFYVGYGHSSIGDCGFVTLYFEGISMLAAKAIEDNPLFNGQECSSRYIDFSNQPFVNPFPEYTPAHGYAQKALDACRTFYVGNLDPVLDDLEKRYPRDPSVTEITYYKTLRAKAFDILRGYLPAGATTNVAWTTSLRKAHDHLVLLMHHPLAEIRELARSGYLALYDVYPTSFKKEYAGVANALDPLETLRGVEGGEVFAYNSLIEHFYVRSYEKGELGLRPTVCSSPWIGFIDHTYCGDPLVLSKRLNVAARRPRKCSLPRHALPAQEPLYIGLRIDFGSFRDLQRHRGGYCSNPILEAGDGFHAWYYENLPGASKAAAETLLEKANEASEAILSGNLAAEDALQRKLQLQYMMPMGALVSVSLIYSLSQAIYVAELRSGKTVHPTLRPVAQSLAKYLNEVGVPTYADMEESDWTAKRGTQDIFLK